MQAVDFGTTPHVPLAAIVQRQEAADMTGYHLRTAISDFLAMDEAARVEQYGNVSAEVRHLFDWIKDCAGRMP